MHAPKYISHQFSGPDEQSRYAYDLNAFPQRESGTLLDTMFYFWNALRGNGASVPLSSQYEPRIIFSEQLPELLSFVDARADNPENFVMIDHPKSSLDPFGSQLSGKTWVNFPIDCTATRFYSNIKSASEPSAPSIMKSIKLSAVFPGTTCG